MFDDWKNENCAYVLEHMDSKPFRPLGGELPATVRELADLHVDGLLRLRLIDEEGRSTGIEYDEDDLLEALLERYLSAHPCDDERALLIAALLDEYLRLSDQFNELAE